MEESSGGNPLTEEMAGALCYLLGILTAVLLLRSPLYRKSRFVRFHAWQSIYFSVAVAALYTLLLLSILMAPLAMVGFLWFFMAGLTLALAAAWFLVTYRAVLGRKWELPIVGAFARRRA